MKACQVKYKSDLEFENLEDRLEYGRSDNPKSINLLLVTATRKAEKQVDDEKDSKLYIERQEENFN